MPKTQAWGRKARYGYFSGKAPQVREKNESAVFISKIALLENEFGGAKLAKIAGVDRSRISRWKRGAKADSTNQERINGLEYVVTRLRGFLAPGSEMKWLYGINAHLGNCRPIDLIERGRVAEVIAAVEQTELGSYA
ncbi:MAG: hypothetical protein HKL90_02285 [Elusimicrobia bacterium]|nr:hypothetical protein [Elusimicrobiota bacterium]